MICGISKLTAGSKSIEELPWAGPGSAVSFPLALYWLEHTILPQWEAVNAIRLDIPEKRGFSVFVPCKMPTSRAQQQCPSGRLLLSPCSLSPSTDIFTLPYFSLKCEFLKVEPMRLVHYNIIVHYHLFFKGLVQFLVQCMLTKHSCSALGCLFFTHSSLDSVLCPPFFWNCSNQVNIKTQAKYSKFSLVSTLSDLAYWPHFMLILS